MILSYHLGFVVGVYAILKILISYPEYAIQGLVAFFTYIATPVAAAISWYCWKAKHENCSKQDQKLLEEEENV